MKELEDTEALVLTIQEVLFANKGASPDQFPDRTKILQTVTQNRLAGIRVLISQLPTES
jgi:hypothetical protein